MYFRCSTAIVHSPQIRLSSENKLFICLPSLIPYTRIFGQSFVGLTELGPQLLVRVLAGLAASQLPRCGNRRPRTPQAAV